MQQRLDDLDDHGLRRRLRPVPASGPLWPGGVDAPHVNFGSNDYLGLAGQPLNLPNALPDEADGPDEADAVPGEANAVPGEANGPAPLVQRGSGASALVCGYTALHHRLARQLAELEQTEAAALFPSGYAACSGCVSALAGRGDLILSDSLNHASLIDGCRLSKAERFVYPHGDADIVDTLLNHHRHRFRRAWIVTDSVFSMDGDIAPLDRLAHIARQHDATLIVDEAHGTGVLGRDGSGASEALGVKDQVPIRIGTLSKALGSQGGFVVGPQVVIDYLINHARPLIYSTAAAPATILAALSALHSVREQPERRQRVQQLARRLRRGLASMGKFTGDLDGLAAGVPIVPIRLRSTGAAVRAAEQLWQQGFYVPAIRPPTVPEGTSRLRVSLSAAHSDEQVDRLLAAIKEL